MTTQWCYSASLREPAVKFREPFVTNCSGRYPALLARTNRLLNVENRIKVWCLQNLEITPLNMTALKLIIPVIEL